MQLVKKGRRVWYVCVWKSIHSRVGNSEVVGGRVQNRDIAIYTYILMCAKSEE